MNSQFLIYCSIAIIMCSSCNLTNKYVRKIDRYYEKLGTVDWMDETDSASIHWRKVGRGEDNLLLLHGFGPLTGLQWRDIVGQLQNDFTIYIPDLIYFGKSTSALKVYDPGFHVRQLHQSLKKEHLEEVYIAGISYGGLISSIYAHEHPDFIAGLILIDALSKFMDENHTDSLANAYGYDQVQDLLIPKDGKALKTMFKISFYKSKKYPAWFLNNPAELLYAQQKEEKKALLNFLKVEEAHIRNQDYSYYGKVQIIWGQQDLLIPVSNAYLLDKYYPNSSLIILPEVGHVANMEAPERVAEVIRQFAIENSPHLP